jgi:hypothetical protein
VSPALAAGIFSGTLSGIPFLNLLSIVWVPAGGVAASYLTMLKEGSNYSARVRISRRAAATAGAASGTFAALVAFIFGVFSGVNFWHLMLGSLTGLGASEATAELVLKVVSVEPGLDVVMLAVKLIGFLVLFPLLGAIGGVVAAELSK